MSDPRTYQRLGAYTDPERDRIDDMVAAEAGYSDEEYEEIGAAWEAKVAEEEVAAASLWDDEPFFDVCL